MEILTAPLQIGTHNMGFSAQFPAKKGPGNLTPNPTLLDLIDHYMTIRAMHTYALTRCWSLLWNVLFLSNDINAPQHQASLLNPGLRNLTRKLRPIVVAL